jgi:hypothetical protein
MVLPETNPKCSTIFFPGTVSILVMIIFPPWFCRYGDKAQSSQPAKNQSFTPEYRQKALKVKKNLNNIIACQKKTLTLTFFIEFFLII